MARERPGHPAVATNPLQTYGAAGPPSLPPPAPSFIPNVPGLVLTVVPTQAPQRTLETGDGGVAVHMPDPHPQPMLCHMMSLDTGNPADHRISAGCPPCLM